MNDHAVADIFVFRTSIGSQNDVQKIARLLNEDARVRHWNVDCGDVDHVLRIESWHQDPAYIISMITAAGFLCEELPD